MQAHHIVSRITGPLRTVEDDDAGQEHNASDSAEDKLNELELDALWRNERPFGRDSRHAPIPFVPARFKFDDFGQLLNPEQAELRGSSSRVDDGDIGSWYSSLQRSSSSTPARIATPPTATNTSSTPVVTKASAAKPKATRNDWFIQKVLSTELPPPPPEPATLSEMLERNPPGPTGAFNPPVWTVIGPGNRGFTLLQRHGWEEGNALGAAAGPSRPRPVPARAVAPPTPEVIDLTIDEDEDDGVVDLTRSEDGDAPDGDSLAGEEAHLEDVEPKVEPEADAELLEASASHGTALLVPLPAFLKPNKHGIGVRAEDKRKLRLKSTAQAIAATTPAGEKKHQQIIDAARKRRLEVGRGARGFARLDRSESTQRQAMMAYLNS
ncbi:hypothetical protein AURDEDRAFT_160042 [Auricularia subglabra TFB-10046 SS5]|nr:hypothetical protein AURDEDRAFT_160042 [Auricularia subglabra TFB-10046 SS5]